LQIQSGQDVNIPNGRVNASTFEVEPSQNSVAMVVGQDTNSGGQSRNIRFRDDGGSISKIRGSNGEVVVEDSAGNTNTISPHHFALMNKSEFMAWSIYQKKLPADRRLNVDMMRVVRLMEKLSAEELAHIAPLNNTTEIDNNSMVSNESVFKRIGRLENVTDSRADHVTVDSTTETVTINDTLKLDAADLGRCTSSGAGTMQRNATDNELYYCDGDQWERLSP
ncbi:MAG: hypothetical protein SVW02_00890, partial [Candidatus Nanohaloarchaea archaeon]|nr:hypothetical protein [Candidatus Nanohaloarchaea archaeon]